MTGGNLNSNAIVYVSDIVPQVKCSLGIRCEYQAQMNIQLFNVHFNMLVPIVLWGYKMFNPMRSSSIQYSVCHNFCRPPVSYLAPWLHPSANLCIDVHEYLLCHSQLVPLKMEWLQ